MKITYYPRPVLLGWLVLVLALLVGGACVPQDMVVGPLGMVGVGVGAGEDIQIRSLEVLTGIGELGFRGSGRWRWRWRITGRSRDIG